MDLSPEPAVPVLAAVRLREGVAYEVELRAPCPAVATGPAACLRLR